VEPAQPRDVAAEAAEQTAVMEPATEVQPAAAMEPVADMEPAAEVEPAADVAAVDGAPGTGEQTPTGWPGGSAYGSVSHTGSADDDEDEDTDGDTDEEPSSTGYPTVASPFTAWPAGGVERDATADSVASANGREFGGADPLP
jgi:hypothetical protein